MNKRRTTDMGQEKKREMNKVLNNFMLKYGKFSLVFCSTELLNMYSSRSAGVRKREGKKW